jgi:hypothetical protein
VTPARPGAAAALERLSKTAALLSALLIVALQIAVHPDGTATIRALAALALIAGWLGAQFSRQSIHAFWLLVAPLAPAVLRIVTQREGPILDLIWMAGLTGTLLRSVSWSGWALPTGWRVLVGGWALTLSLAWPVIVLREISFDPRLLRDMGAVNSWAQLAAPQVVAWTLHVGLTQLLGLVWLDWLVGRLTAEPERTPRAVHALWIGATIASVVALYQATVDIGFLSTAAWAARARATGTMLDANAYGVLAAIGGPIAVLALRRSRLPRALLISLAVLLIDFAGMWVSGSRTALLCALGGVVGLTAGAWTTGTSRVRRLIPVAAVTAIVIVALLIVASAAVGPVRRLLEQPARSGGLVDSLINRGGYGTIANRIISDYPLTGVGMGGYQVIAPDYWRAMVDEQLPFDNAQNWWRQTLAEFGILGGAAVLVWSAIVAWLVIAGRSRPTQRITSIGVRGLLLGVGACSLLGIPTQTPVVLLAFFVLVAWLSVLVRDPDIPALANRASAAWTVVTVLAVAYAGGHVALAQGPLAVRTRVTRAGLSYVAGTYPPEPLADGGQFRWTRDHAELIMRAETPWLVFRVWVNHPDLGSRPVHVQLLTQCGAALDEDLRSPTPVSVAVHLPFGERVVDARIRVSRTWRPSRFGSPDPRELGAAVTTAFVPDGDQARQAERVVDLTACRRPDGF